MNRICQEGYENLRIAVLQRAVSDYKENLDEEEFPLCSRDAIEHWLTSPSNAYLFLGELDPREFLSRMKRAIA